jgi:hypothetical protein
MDENDDKGVSLEDKLTLEVTIVKDCERCCDEAKRRILCYHCGHYVCGWCWHHECRCEPGHSRATCIHFKQLKKMGRNWYLKNVVARLRVAAGLPLLKGMR